MRLAQILWHYARVKMRKINDREALIKFQQKSLDKLKHKYLLSIPYFKQHCQGDFSTWPLMNKEIMLENFEVMNSGGISLTAAYDEALSAELTRDFKPTIQGYTIGLSSGTSKSRGVFLLSEAEERQWAGTILAKMLPGSLLRGERIAFFLRANSNLYETVHNHFIAFQFFDLFKPLAEQVQTLIAFQPTVLIAPAQVLEKLAELQLPIQPIKVISVAEVLDNRTREKIEQQFGTVHEIYQATEGFIASTCVLGNLHLNEDLMIIEEERINESHFIPIITDFNRRTQPMIRYRLDDILIKHPEKCPCGSPFQRLAGIDGRLNDTLLLPTNSSDSVTIFADLCLRVLARVLPYTCDFKLTQDNRNTLTLSAQTSKEILTNAQDALAMAFATQGVNIDLLQWHLQALSPQTSLDNKRRKIQRLFDAER